MALEWTLVVAAGSRDQDALARAGHAPIATLMPAEMSPDTTAAPAPLKSPGAPLDS
jgi:hypothetical protein